MLYAKSLKEWNRNRTKPSIVGLLNTNVTIGNDMFPSNVMTTERINIDSNNEYVEIALKRLKNIKENKKKFLDNFVSI